MFCVCCLVKDLPFISLNSCTHTEFLESWFKYQDKSQNLVTCVHCHEMLKKIDLFKKQILRSVFILNRQSSDHKIHNLNNIQRNNVEITVNINPTSVNHLEFINEDVDYVKVKSDLSDNDNEGQLSDDDSNNEVESYNEMNEFMSQFENNKILTSIPIEQPRANGKRCLVKLKPVKLSNVDSNCEEYTGKLKMVLYNKDDLARERMQMRKDKKYWSLEYKCKSCIIGFHEKKHLIRHITKRHKEGIGPFVCDVCNSVFKTNNSLKPHYRRHFVRYDCTECGKRLIDQRAAIAHFNQNHGKNGATVGNKFKCKLGDCTYETHSFGSFRTHRSKHDSYPCKLCDKVYGKWLQLRSHIYGVHNKKKVLHKCEKCSKVYKDRCGLRKHIETVHNDIKVISFCGQCKLTFKTENNLKQHLKLHKNHITEENKKFICDDCGARFLAKYLLKRHIQWKHLENSMYKCPQCSKVLQSARSLRSHIAFVHEGKQLPKDKICDYCGKGFSTVKTLNNHRMRHTGERPHKCPYCEAAFIQRTAMLTHAKARHKDYPPL